MGKLESISLVDAECRSRKRSTRFWHRTATLWNAVET